ncbi:MAG: hypothetical protein ACXWJ6_15005 [Xanthobacteraceae bacterium]
MTQSLLRRFVVRTLVLAAMGAAIPGTVLAQASKYPASDRVWMSADYKDLDAVIAAGFPLPTLGDAATRPVFERMSNVANLDMVRNKSLPVGSRLQEGVAQGGYVQKLLLAYLTEAQKGKPYATELAKLQVYLLAYGAALIGVADEFVPTIPHDDKYETRMAGFAQMKQGLRTIVTGIVESVGETQFYSIASTIEMAKALADYTPALGNILSDQDRQDYVRRISRDLDTVADPNMKAALTQAITVLTAKK